MQIQDPDPSGLDPQHYKIMSEEEKKEVNKNKKKISRDYKKEILKGNVI